MVTQWQKKANSMKERSGADKNYPQPNDTVWQIGLYRLSRAEYIQT
jgi:hypothetical protein